ncbi:uncharacterized protein LOC142323301 [Lycorma delicatula]|uniref:uncharacterized protein LOC142323301 n=1 Tax=Lycorma delicatula TaxID=130591 RepID=UPI003F51167D
MSRKIQISVFLLLVLETIAAGVTTTTVGVTDIESHTLQEGRKCPDNFCETARFKCLSEDSCNGTLLAPTDPCQCCPTCVKFREEGEPCESEETAASEDKSVSSFETTTVMITEDINTKNMSEDGEKVNSQKSDDPEYSTKIAKTCKSGLTCLMGTCVVLL